VRTSPAPVKFAERCVRPHLIVPASGLTAADMDRSTAVGPMKSDARRPSGSPLSARFQGPNESVTRRVVKRYRQSHSTHSRGSWWHVIQSRFVQLVPLSATSPEGYVVGGAASRVCGSALTRCESGEVYFGCYAVLLCFFF